MIMPKPTIECTRVRACKWKGNNEDLVKVKNMRESLKYKMDISDAVCPRCGCKTMYDIKPRT